MACDRKVTGEAPVAWATREFAQKLGLPASWYAFDSIGDDGAPPIHSCPPPLLLP